MQAAREECRSKLEKAKGRLKRGSEESALLKVKNWPGRGISSDCQANSSSKVSSARKKDTR
jgi:hypothetical protein